MRDYAPLWETMQRKGVTTYTLINTHKFSKGTIYKLKHNQNVNIQTLEDLCEILECNIQDVVKVIPRQKTTDACLHKP